VFDGSLLEVLEDLIASDAAAASDRTYFLQVGYIEITYSPGEDFSIPAQLLEGRECLLQRISAAPMKQTSWSSTEELGETNRFANRTSCPGAVGFPLHSGRFQGSFITYYKIKS
jgi:hypothetical protein